MKLTVTVVITTRDRKQDLQHTLRMLGQLDPQPDEIIVCADGCTDGTVEFVKSLPHIRLMVNEVPRGSINSRNSIIREASGDLVLSLDDDSHPVEPDFIRQICVLFESRPRLAVATFPQRSDEFPESLTQEDFGPSHFVASYTSSGAAIRRAVFLELKGYPELFFHAYEEPDFALRCMAAGWHVRFENSLHIRHQYSGAQRNEIRIHHFQARNELWSVILRCPFPHLFAVGTFRILRQWGYACNRGLQWVLREPAWWLGFCAGLPACLSMRSPIPWKQYRRWMMLLRSPATSQWEFGENTGDRVPP
jgi:GT2 family glycosyltransferase